MRKLNAALSLRGIRRDKESTSVLLDDDDSSKSSSSSETSSESDRKSLKSSDHSTQKNTQTKVMGKVRASIPKALSGRKNRPKSMPAARSAEITVNRSLLPEKETPKQTPKSPVRATSGKSLRSKSMGMMFMSDMEGSGEFFEYHNEIIKNKPQDSKKPQKTEPETGSSAPSVVDEKAAPTRRPLTPFRTRERGSTCPATPKHQRSKSVGAAAADIDTSSPLKRMVIPDGQKTSPAQRPRATTAYRPSRLNLVSESEKDDSKTSAKAFSTKPELVPVKVDHQNADASTAQPYAQLSLAEATPQTGWAEIDTSSPLKRMVKSDESPVVVPNNEPKLKVPVLSSASADTTKRSTTPFRCDRLLHQMTDIERDELKYGAQPYRPRTPSVSLSNDNSTGETPQRRAPLRAPSGANFVGLKPPSQDNINVGLPPRRKTPLRAPSGEDLFAELQRKSEVEIDTSSPSKAMIKTEENSLSPRGGPTSRPVTPYRRKVESSQDQTKSSSRPGAVRNRSSTPYQSSKKDKLDSDSTHTSASRRRSQAPTRNRSTTPYRGSTSRTDPNERAASSKLDPPESPRRRSSNVARRTFGGSNATPGRSRTERRNRSSGRASRSGADDEPTQTRSVSRHGPGEAFDNRANSAKSVASVFEKQPAPPSTLSRARSKSTSKRVSSKFSNQIAGAASNDDFKVRSKSTGRPVPSPVPVFAPPKHDTKRRTK